MPASSVMTRRAPLSVSARSNSARDERGSSGTPIAAARVIAKQPSAASTRLPRKIATRSPGYAEAG